MEPKADISYRTSEARAAWLRGWLLTPLNGKIPILNDWPNLGPPSQDEVTAWAASQNLGLRTGVASGVVVIDIDTSKIGSRPPEERALHTEFMGLLRTIRTPVVITGSGGQHWYFRYNSAVKNTAGRLAPCVDTRGDKGQVVYAGSVHPDTGRIYEWAGGLSPADLPLADVPGWILARLKRKNAGNPGQVMKLPTPTPSGTKYGVKALEAEVERVTGATVGERNTRLNEAAFNLGQLVAGGQLDGSVVVGTLLKAIQSWADPDEERKASGPNGTIERGLRDGMKLPRGPAPSTAPLAGVVTHPSSAPVVMAQLDVEAAGSKPRILIPGPHVLSDGYVEVGNDDFCRKVLEILPVGAFYRRAEQVGSLERHEGALRFRRMTSARCRNLVDEHMALLRWVEKGKERTPQAIYQNASDDHAALILSAGESSHSVRELLSLTNYPVCAGTGFRVVSEGWNPEFGAYYDPSVRIEVVRNVETIRSVLADLVHDFPFASDADRINFYGLLLTPIVRPALGGNVPIHVVHSPLERTGKTKLIEEVLGGVILGRPTPAMQFSASEEERDKRILALLTRAENIIHLDNLRNYIDSASLASLTTGTTYMGRILSRSEMVTAQNNLTIAASGNNVKMTGELSKRCVSIQLMPVSDHPENRTDYEHPDLRSYVTAVRGSVLGCLLGMIENWRAKNQPAYSSTLGGFEKWSHVIGGILAVNGLEGHRGNQSEWLARTDSAAEELRAFVDLWAASEERDATGYLRFGLGKLVMARDLFELATNNDLFGDLMAAGSTRSQLSAFGRRVLAQNQDTPIGSYRIRKCSSGSANLWKLEEILPN